MVDSQGQREELRILLDTHEDPDRLAQDLLEILKTKGRTIVLKASGYSMLPTILHGDELVIEHVSPSAIRRGDLITFYAGSTVVTHRVVRLKRTRSKVSILQKGDNGVKAYPLPPESIIGKVVTIHSGGIAIALKGPFATGAGFITALIESMLLGPIQTLSDRMKGPGARRGWTTLYLYRALLHLRHRCVRALCGAVRRFCKSRD